MALLRKFFCSINLCYKNDHWAVSIEQIVFALVDWELSIEQTEKTIFISLIWALSIEHWALSSYLSARWIEHWARSSAQNWNLIMLNFKICSKRPALSLFNMPIDMCSTRVTMTKKMIFFVGGFLLAFF